MTLKEAAYIIYNEVTTHIVNSRISIEQIKDELIITANRVIGDSVRSGMFLDKELDQVASRIGCVPVECKDISECCNVKSKKMVLVADDIPVMLNYGNESGMRYVGLIDWMNPFKKIYGDFPEYTLHDKWTGKVPTAWMDGNRIIIFNPPTLNMKYIAIRGVLSDIKDLLKYDCCVGSYDDIEFGCPKTLQDVIIGKVSESYLRRLGQPKLQTNTQSDLTVKKV